MSNLTEHAKRELGLAGFFGKESDYDGMIGEAVMELIKVFAKQGHSGNSAMTTLYVFDKVARFENIMPISDNKDEWMEVGTGVFQCKRNPELFSKDGLKTYYKVSKPNIKLQFTNPDKKKLK